MKIYANDNLVYDKDFTDTPLRSIAVDTAQGRVAVIPIANQDLPIHLTFEFVSLSNMVVPTLVNKEELLALSKKVQDAVDDESNFDDEKASKSKEKEDRAEAAKKEKDLNEQANMTDAEKLEANKKAEADANADAKRKDEEDAKHKAEEDAKHKAEEDKRKADLNHPNTINPITPPVHNTPPVVNPSNSNKEDKNKK